MLGLSPNHKTNMNENPEIIPTANPVPDEGGPILKVCPGCGTFPDYMHYNSYDGTSAHRYLCRNNCMKGLAESAVTRTELEARESWNAIVDQLTNHVELS